LSRSSPPLVSRTNSSETGDPLLVSEHAPVRVVVADDARQPDAEARRELEVDNEVVLVGAEVLVDERALDVGVDLHLVVEGGRALRRSARAAPGPAPRGNASSTRPDVVVARAGVAEAQSVNDVVLHRVADDAHERVGPAFRVRVQRRLLLGLLTPVEDLSRASRVSVNVSSARARRSPEIGVVDVHCGRDLARRVVVEARASRSGGSRSRRSSPRFVNTDAHLAEVPPDLHHLEAA
jgi:hypothetical protein